MTAAPTNPCTVFHEIVHAPWAHPVWHSYSVCMITLKDVEGFPPAAQYFIGATHELQIWALDPQKGTILTPGNYIGQFTFASDAMAHNLGQRIAELIKAQQLNPDTDFLTFNATFIETAAVQEFNASRAQTSWKGRVQ